MNALSKGPIAPTCFENIWEEQLLLQAVDFRLPSRISPTIKILFDVSRSMAGWLVLSRKHVAMVQCKNGKARSLLAMSCFLRYIRLVESTADGLELLLKQRCPGVDVKTFVDGLGPTFKRYLRYFNDIIAMDGRVPNAIGMQLHQIIVNTVPNFDGKGDCDPGVDVAVNGHQVYSSISRLAELVEMSAEASEESADEGEMLGDEGDGAADGGVIGRVRRIFSRRDTRSETLTEDAPAVKVSSVTSEFISNHSAYNPLVLKDAHHVVFRLEDIQVIGDVQLRVFHYNASAGQNVTIANIAFNTGFMLAGLIRMQAAEVERPMEGTSIGGQARFSPDFSVDLVLTQLPAVVDLQQSASSLTSIPGSSGSLAYTSACQWSLARCLLKLSHALSVQPDQHAAKALELQGHRRFLARLALQLRNNEIHEAHELLAALATRSDDLMNKLDAELTAISRRRWERVRRASEQRLKSPAIADTDVDAPLPSLEELRISASDLPSPIRPDPLGQLSEMKERLKHYTADVAITENEGKAGESFEAESTPSIAARNAPPFLLASADVSRRPSLSKSLPPVAPPLPTSNTSSSSKAPLNMPPPPPMPPQSPFSMNATATQTPLPEDPNKPTVKTALHWQELKHQHQIRDTVWGELLASPAAKSGTPNLDSIAVHRFEELFCVSPEAENVLKSTRPQGSSVSRKEEALKTVLDLRRANNVGIGLSRFYRRLSDREILECIVAERGKGLSLDDLLTLKPLLPTLDEVSALRSASADLTSRAEKFMVVMASEPLLPWMLDLLIYERQFQSELENITGKASMITTLLARLCESNHIKTLLRTVLDLGNLASYEYGRKAAMLKRTGKALGFRLETLIKLSEVTSVDKKTTLLDYLVGLLKESNPDVLELPSEFSDVRMARYCDAQALQAEYGELKAEFKRLALQQLDNASEPAIEFHRQSTAFVNVARECLQHADRLVASQLPSAWKITATYFGEDHLSTKPEDLFAIFDQFFKQLRASVEAIPLKTASKESVSTITISTSAQGGTSLASSASDAVVMLDDNQ